ncbi:MAG: glycosyltransferase WbsX family protein [Nocardioidaceae bacterium]
MTQSTGLSPQPAADPATPTRANVAAFYLPQFHRIAENDEWWGPGFTDWTNVRRARASFAGHPQPRVPGQLGYYDLSDPAVHHAQHALAQRHGVTAFCYYTYWFEGRRLLQKPLEVMLEEQGLDASYFLCWANENWTRTWDGQDQQVLMAQRHDPRTDAAFIDDMAPHLADPRYLRIDGKPLLLVYRPSLMSDPARSADAMRERAQALGLGELHLGMVQSFGAWDPRGLGFDSAVEFPPHSADSKLFAVAPSDSEHPELFDAETWRGGIYSYERCIEWAMSKPVPSFPWFRGVMPSWDNTPRRQERASLFVGDSPARFQTWLERALHYTYLFNPPSHWLVFVNAWNEWAEGAVLEPDVENGDARLRAVAQALRNTDPLAQDSARAHERRVAGDLLDIARAYYRSSAVLGRETLARYVAP